MYYYNNLKEAVRLFVSKPKYYLNNQRSEKFCI